MTFTAILYWINTLYHFYLEKNGYFMNITIQKYGNEKVLDESRED